MSLWAGLLIIIVSAGIAGLMSWIVHQRVSRELRRHHQEVGGSIFLQLGVVYAVLLAFVFSGTWSNYDSADMAINQECGALHASAMLAASLPDGRGHAFNLSVAGYIETVIHDEWPLMARHERSRKAQHDLLRMIDAATDLEIAAATHSSVPDHILSLLVQAHDSRETRLFQMNKAVPPALWALLIFYTAVLIGFVLLADLQFRLSLMMFTSLFAACTVMILVMIRMLDYPFQGTLALMPDDFERTLQSVLALIGTAGRG